MKDSKTIRNEHQSFVDAYKKINESSVQDKPVEEGYGYKSMDKKKKKTKKEEMVLVRKSNAFTALAEKYNMSPKQFGRYVEANQHLFDIPTRKKAILANKFQGFKETKEWDEFFGDLELVEMDLKKLFKLKKGSKEQQDLDPTSSQKKDKLLQHKLGQELDKAHYELEGELVDEGAPYTVNVADKKGNTPAYQNYKKGMLNKLTGKPLYKPGFGLEKASYEPEGDELQEITTKDTKSGTKFKVRVKDKATGSSYIRFATRDKIAQLRSDPKIASVEMTDEGQTPEERGEKKAQAAGGGSQKKAKKDYDGDGKVESGKAEYMGSRDKAIKKAMKKRSVTTEGLEGDQLDEINAGYSIDPGKAKTKVVPGTRVNEIGAEGGGKPSEGNFKKDFPDETKKPETKKPETKKPEISKFTKQGKPRTKAQMMAAKRIAAKKAGTYTKPKTAQELAKARIGSGTAKNPDKTIADVKKDNNQAMKDRARARHAAFKAKRAERRAARITKEELSNWRQDLKEIMGEVEKTEGKKPKSKKMKNGICINPDTDDEKNKYEEVNAQKIAENLGAELQSLKIEDADGNVAYEVIDLVKPDPMKENVMLTYKSGKGFDAKVHGVSARDTVSNVKKAGETIKNIKSDGLVGGVKKTFNKKTTEKPSVSSNIDTALKNYKSTISSSYEMETEDLQQTVTNILDKGSNFMKNTKVGRVLGKVFGPSNPKNKGSDYTPSGKVAR